MRLKVVLEECVEGGYTVYIPALPGCISEGDSVEEAMINIREAAELYLEPLELKLKFQENEYLKKLNYERGSFIVLCKNY